MPATPLCLKPEYQLFPKLSTFINLNISSFFYNLPADAEGYEEKDKPYDAAQNIGQNVINLKKAAPGNKLQALYPKACNSATEDTVPKSPQFFHSPASQKSIGDKQ